MIITLALAPLNDFSIVLVKIFNFLLGSILFLNLFKLIFDFFKFWVIEDIVIVIPVSTVVDDVSI